MDMFTLKESSNCDGERIGMKAFPFRCIWYSCNRSNQLDSLSAMTVEINGRRSCGQRSRDISIRYFFINKDNINNGTIEVVHCPTTESMLADIFIKPLQGATFKKFCDVIMGKVHIRTLMSNINPVQNKERWNMNRGTIIMFYARY